MNWKKNLSGKKDPLRVYKTGTPWIVKDIAEARKFLKDISCNEFTTMGTRSAKVPIELATDKQIMQILTKLNVTIRDYVGSDEVVEDAK